MNKLHPVVHTRNEEGVSKREETRMPTRRLRRKWIVMALIGIVLLGGLWFFVNFLFLAEKPSLEEKGIKTPPSPQQAEQVQRAREPGGMVEPFSPGTLMVSPRKQQAIGVRSTTVQVRPLVRTMRTIGLVEVDERLISHVHIKLQGWIEKLYVQFKGEEVQKDQMLFEIYSPELVATQDEYLLALQAVADLGTSEFPEVAEGARSLLEVTKRRFALWDITPDHIEELERTGKVLRTLPLHAPISGYVLSINIREGMYVTPDLELYTLADLSKVWVLADFYEYEIPEVQVGQEALVTLSYFPEKVFKGKVTYIYPTLDPKTRTVKVRFEFPNPGWKLKPGMFANVELRILLGERLVVPHTAVLDSGTEQRVFVDLGNGMFEPRQVTIGVRTKDWYEIRKGLKVDEIVVTRANFLLDSESNLRSASDMMMPGMEMGSKGKPDSSSAMPAMQH